MVDEVQVLGIKCMCSECRIPSATRGGQQQETANQGDGKTIDNDAIFRVHHRKGDKKGKGPDTHIMATGKFLLACSAGKSKSHFNLVQQVLAGIDEGIATTMDMAKQALVE